MTSINIIYLRLSLLLFNTQHSYPLAAPHLDANKWNIKSNEMTLHR